MKFGYEKPMITIEEYAVDTAIAAGCTSIVSMGPEGMDGSGVFHTACEEYKEETFDANPFYDETVCSCYLSSGGSTLMSS